MLAKIVAMVCALYWGVTNKKRSAGIGAYYARGTGVEVYARAWAEGQASHRGHTFTLGVGLEGIT